MSDSQSTSASSQGIQVGALDISGLVNKTKTLGAFFDEVDDETMREAFNSSDFEKYKENVEETIPI